MLVVSRFHGVCLFIPSWMITFLDVVSLNPCITFRPSWGANMSVKKLDERQVFLSWRRCLARLGSSS